MLRSHQIALDPNNLLSAREGNKKKIIFLGLIAKEIVSRMAK